MKEYQAVCCCFDEIEKNMDFCSVIVKANNSEEAKSKAESILKKEGKKRFAIQKVIEKTQVNAETVEDLSRFAEFYDTYEKKVSAGKEIVNNLMQYLVFDKSEILGFVMAIRALFYHLSKIDGVISFQEYCFCYDLIQTGEEVQKLTKEDYENFLSESQRNKKAAGSDDEIAFGEKFIKGLLQSPKIDIVVKFNLLRLAALFFSVDGKISVNQKEYLLSLVEI